MITIQENETDNKSDKRNVKQRRKTIYQLDSYMSTMEDPDKSSVSTDKSSLEFDFSATEPTESKHEGRIRINLSPLTQKIVGCVIGENLTAEYAWVQVKKEIIEDNIYLHPDTSDFLPVASEIFSFPDQKVLIGYDPKLNEEAQFYICLTTESRDAVLSEIEAIQNAQKNEVQNSIYKIANQWTELGSSKEIDTSTKRIRPPFEYQFETTAGDFRKSILLTNRTSNDQRDAYIELVPTARETFETIEKTLIHSGISSIPELQINQAQTKIFSQVDGSTQYSFLDFPIFDLNDKDHKRNVVTIVRLLNNSYKSLSKKPQFWDIYSNDLKKLVRNERDTLSPFTINYNEHQSYYDGNLCANKVINDLCWHPLLTDIIFVAYAEHSTTEYLKNPPDYNARILYESKNYILVWSLTNYMTPILILDCPREIRSIAVCPINGDIIIGGCCNGQVAIWDITGKIENVENINAKTPAQERYKQHMKSLMTWTKSMQTTLVRVTAMSSLQFSQNGAITKIIWIPPYNNVGKNGKINSLPKDASSDDLTWQFATSSEDGTIAFWNIKEQLNEEKKIRSIGKKFTKEFAKPKALTETISLFKVLDDVLKPDFIVVASKFKDPQSIPITTMSFYEPRLKKELLKQSLSDTEDNWNVRQYFQFIFEKPEYDFCPRILVGTSLGTVGLMSWEGYDLNTEVTVNKEHCSWLWKTTIHDGPVNQCARSKYLDDVVATIGGNIFAIWRDDFDTPVIRRKSDVRYTDCSWGYRSTILILARADGLIEVWDFIMKSHEPYYFQKFSKQIVTALYTRDPLWNSIYLLTYCDSEGYLRVYRPPSIFLVYDQSDIQWMRKFIDRQVEIIKDKLKNSRNDTEKSEKELEIQVDDPESEDEEYLFSEVKKKKLDTLSASVEEAKDEEEICEDDRITSEFMEVQTELLDALKVEEMMLAEFNLINIIQESKLKRETLSN